MAPISGQVIGLSVTPGQELQANTTLVTISDTSTVIISATVDERNISYIKPGMPVDLDQWGTTRLRHGGDGEPFQHCEQRRGHLSHHHLRGQHARATCRSTAMSTISSSASQNDNCLVLPIQAVRTVSHGGRLQPPTVVYVQADSRPDNAHGAARSRTRRSPAASIPFRWRSVSQDTYNVEIKSGVK